jgi:hypothetical protein
MLDRWIRRRLANAPALLTAYLLWVNRGRRQLRRDLSVAFSLCMAWAAAVLMYVNADRLAAMSTLEWVGRHELICASVCAIVAGMLVSRRRALNRITASRSWTAALPVERSIARWQAIAVESIPAVVLACVLTITLGSMSLIAIFEPGMQAPILAWVAATGGVALGAGLSYLLPSAKPEEIPERSRYVPHRRRVGSPIPRGSLSALGSWPVRQMLASARPRAIARAMMPMLIAVPLGSTAADVMLATGLLTAMGALVLLVGAAIAVCARASRWLKPLPLGPGRLARKTLFPVFASMFCTTAIESWLIWVLGSPIARCIWIGVITLAAGMIFALVGSLFAIYAVNKGNSGRL